jgi:glycosyltransferase involved in cell wall biosynthesis
MTSLPLVSIVITSFNRAHWISHAIQSALNQDYANTEIIVSDNASTDNSEEVILAFCEDPRVKYSRNEQNIGMVGNFNKAFFEIAKGRYILHISSDDYLIDSNFVTLAVKTFLEYENVVLIFGKYQELRMVNNKTTNVAIPHYYQKAFRTGQEVLLDYNHCQYLHWGGAIMNRELLGKEKIYITDTISADKLISYELMTHGNVGFVDVNAYMVRFHNNNFSQTTEYKVEDIKNAFEAIEHVYKKALLINNANIPKLTDWKKLNITNLLRSNLTMNMTLRRQQQYDVFKSFAIQNYHDIYMDIVKKDKKYLIVKNIILPLTRIKLLKKILYFIFPKRHFFASDNTSRFYV